MRLAFADSGYWVALLNPRDQLREKAQTVSKRLSECQIVTSEMVLVEVLNSLAGKGQVIRQAAVRLVEEFAPAPK